MFLGSSAILYVHIPDCNLADTKKQNSLQVQVTSHSGGGICICVPLTPFTSDTAGLQPEAAAQGVWILI